MSTRRKKHIPAAFETIGGNNLSAAIYATMIQSAAWERLTNNARVLYLYMKLQYYGAKPIKEHPQTDFYFNAALATKTYRLYTNLAQFRKDRQQLIDLGFIEIVENRKNMRKKNIYRFSDKWKDVR